MKQNNVRDHVNDTLVDDLLEDLLDDCHKSGLSNLTAEELDAAIADVHDMIDKESIFEMSVDSLAVTVCYLHQLHQLRSRFK